MSVDYSGIVISQIVVANHAIQCVVVYNQHKLVYRKYTNNDV